MPSDQPPLQDLIREYLNNKPDFGKFINPEAEREAIQYSKDTQGKIPDQHYLYKKANGIPLTEKEHQQLVNELRIVGHRNPQIIESSAQSKQDPINMPVHPAEENTSGNITDQVAKDSSDSTASSHPAHQGDNQATSGGAIGAQAHKANPGPVIVDGQDIGKPASREELKAKAAELNK